MVRLFIFIMASLTLIYRCSNYASYSTSQINGYTMVRPGVRVNSAVDILNKYSQLWPTNNGNQGRLEIKIPYTSSARDLIYIDTFNNTGIQRIVTIPPGSSSYSHILSFSIALNGKYCGCEFTGGTTLPQNTTITWDIPVNTDWHANSGDTMRAEWWNKILVWGGGFMNNLVTAGNAVTHTTINYYRAGGIQVQTLAKDAVCSGQTTLITHNIENRSITINI